MTDVLVYCRWIRTDMANFPTIDPKFDQVLASDKVPPKQWNEFKKWIRFYLYFCEKYQHNPADTKSLPQFIKKLASKNQTPVQLAQARQAVERYSVLLMKIVSKNVAAVLLILSSKPRNISEIGTVQSNFHILPPATAIYANSSDSRHILPKIDPVDFREQANAAWRGIETALKNEIMLRHYSNRTLKSYMQYVRKLRGFMVNKDPSLLTPDDVKKFLTDMAVNKKVSGASQNLAFNALLFLFRHVLKKELESLLAGLEGPYKLMAQIMYGCGLRLSEAVTLRVHNFNFDEGILTVQFGKGGKSRTVPLPEKIRADISAQFETVKLLHREDLEKKYAGVFMPGLFENNSKFSAQELLGHSDVRTTMIYTHTIKSEVKEIKSPLDF